MSKKAKIKIKKFNALELGAALMLQKHKVRTLLRKEGLNENVEMTEEELLKLYEKYYGGD
jgi:hypothetical protein